MTDDCCSFPELLDAHRLTAFEDLESSVQLILTDPPYNIRRERGDEHANYDSLTLKDMNTFAGIAGSILRPGGHGVIFCSHHQFSHWVEALEGIVTTPTGHQKPAQVFAIDPLPLHFIRNSNVFSAYPGRYSSTLVNTVEYAVHFKKIGNATREHPEVVSYKCHNFVKSTMQGYRNVIDNVRGLVPTEEIRVPDVTNARGSRALRNEQKPLSLLKELISRFSGKGDIVVDMFGGTFSCAIACFDLDEQRRFIGCEQDLTCFQVARDHVIRKYAHRITTSSWSNVNGSTKRFARELLRRSGSKKSASSVLYAPRGLPPFQIIPFHILLYMCSKCNDNGGLLKYKEIQPDLWPRSYQAMLQQVTSQDLLVHDAASQGIMLTSVYSKGGELECVTGKCFEAGDVVCNVYGTIVYSNMEDESNKIKIYEEGIFAVTLDEYNTMGRKLEIHGPKFQQVRRKENVKAVTLVPASFCSARYIRNFSTSTDLNEPEDIVPQSNVAVVQSASNLNHPKKLLSHDLLQVRATRNITQGTLLVLEKTVHGNVNDNLPTLNID